MNLFDASALLCFLRGERGAKTVAQQLEQDSACSAANWSEVAQKVRARTTTGWSVGRDILLSFGLVIEPVHAADAERAAELWRPGTGLSLADRLCLATAERLDAAVWTAEQAWGTEGRVRQVR